jgi:fructuronate reductase
MGIALVPCDNIPANGKLLAGAMTQLFSVFGQQAVEWLGASVSFVSTSIDRITPRTTDTDIETVQEQTGYLDASPVVTEPFSDWVLEGRFPLGRPAWENAGARFVEHIEPFENRKLWMLNGAHSLLAYLGQLRGHATVSQAIADSVCLAAVEEFWNEAERTLNNPALELRAYRQALLERFGNQRIAHQLAQIGIDGATKVRVRAIPTLQSELAAGRSAGGAIGVVAAWIAYVIANPTAQDSRAAELGQALAAAAGNTPAAVRNLLALLEPAAAENLDLLERVTARVLELQKSDKETA